MSRILTVLRLVHAWAGLILSLMLFTLALSGSLLVFRTEITRALTPGAEQTVANDPAAFARAVTTAQATFGKGQVASINFASPEFGLHQVNLKGGGGAYLDPNTGAVLQRWGENERFFDWLFDLHHHLLSGEIGTRVTGWTGLGGLLLTLVGVAIWWPARGAFRGRVAPRSFKRAHLLAAHRDLGILAAPFLAVTLVTGVSLALPQQARPLWGAVESKPKAPRLKAAADGVDWTAGLSAAQARFPDARLRMAVFPKKPGAPVQVRMRRPGEWHSNGRTSVTLAPDGRVLAASDAMAQPRGVRTYNGLWPIHASKVGGPVWKVFSLLTGLSLAALSLFGAVAFAPRAFGRPRR